MNDRQTAIAAAHTWAAKAEFHAGIFIAARAEQDIAAVAAWELEEHARGMALMWAAVAQLPEDGICGALYDSFFAAGQERICTRAPHPSDPWHQAEDGTKFREVAAPLAPARCHSRYKHPGGIQACTREPHHHGLHCGGEHTWPTSAATEATRHFRCGYCGCAENPAHCGCDHEGDAIPHQRGPAAPS